MWKIDLFTLHFDLMKKSLVPNAAVEQMISRDTMCAWEDLKDVPNLQEWNKRKKD